jgi:predicted metalloendopeptidase
MTTIIEQPSVDELEPSIRPQDDLFGHVNDRWIQTSSIPDDRSTWGSFEILRDQADANVRAIIEDAAKAAARAAATDATDEQRIGELYASFMDEEAIEALGSQPIQPILDRIAAVGDVEGFVHLLGELQREGVSGMLGMRTAVDRGDPSRYLLHVSQGGIGLPDESYYRLDEYSGIRDGYVAMLARMLELAAAPGVSDAGVAADQVMALETRIASAHWDRAAIRDAVKTYNLTTADELRRVLPVAPAWFEGMGADDSAWSEVVVSQPDVLEALATALQEVDLDTWKRWLAARTINGFAPYLSSDFVDTRFAFYGRTLTGAPSNKDRWKRGVALVEGVVGEAVGRLYVERHYPDEAAKKMDELVANLLEAYRVRITDLEWMADETRERALGKLAAFRPKVGMPVKWRDYTGLDIDASDLIGNVLRSNAFDFEYRMNKLDEPVDRDEWFMTPQTVNAYYNPTMNEIVFPAAILQPPFFDAEIDPAYNYGAIGAVIGHEIGHGFDDQGSRYDGDGTLRDWWTDHDREQFDDKTRAFIEQYNDFSPRHLSDDHSVNGALTVGENIGDLGGVTVAHHAYRLSLDGEEPSVIDGLTGDQRFFVGWARAWRVQSRPEESIRRLAIDPHAPPEFRANVVRNIDAFHDAFETAPGDGLWLDPSDRVSIW